MKRIALTGNVILPDEILAGGVVLIEDEVITGVFYNDNNLPESDMDFRRYGDMWINQYYEAMYNYRKSYLQLYFTCDYSGI